MVEFGPTHLVEYREKTIDYRAFFLYSLLVSYNLYDKLQGSSHRVWAKMTGLALNYF